MIIYSFGKVPINIRDYMCFNSLESIELHREDMHAQGVNNFLPTTIIVDLLFNKVYDIQKSKKSTFKRGRL